MLVPAPNPSIRRDRDIAALRQAECEYRGITATYDELTRAYVLKTYSDGALLRWQTCPSPQNPASEALVTGLFSVGPSKRVDERKFIHQLRDDAPPHLGITWRYSTLAATRISPANDYARDALETFTHTVDAFIARMVVARQDITLKSEPSIQARADSSIALGTILLVEDRTCGWLKVRLPSSAIVGWTLEQHVEPIE
jgi:hypothetical protein